MEVEPTSTRRTPRHFRQARSGPVSGLMAARSLARYIAFPGRWAQWRWMYLDATYRCGGSTGIAGRLDEAGSRTCFPFILRAGSPSGT